MRLPSSRWRSLAGLVRAAQVRSRFLIALLIAFPIVAKWDVIRTHWDRWTSPPARDSSMGAVSSDTEYFCPMDPGVLSGWPGRCGVCQMALVRRAKGDMEPLPSGVLARVQLSPDRLLLGGIRSEPVRFRPLAREIRLLGEPRLDGNRLTIRAEVGVEDASWLAPNQPAEVVPDPPDGSLPVVAKIRSVEVEKEGRVAVNVEVADASPTLKASGFLLVTVCPPLAGREPFRSMARGLPAIKPSESRAAHACPDHPEILRVEPGRCPIDRNPLEPFDIAPDQRIGYWCPMHPKVVADRAGSKCGDCGGMELIPRIVTFAPVGEVLAVPESAVVDTGTRRVVYVERMPGTFDAVEVRLGPRAGRFYPVADGLEPGQSVASSGAFLIDAETRLNPSLAAGYFGARRLDAPSTSRSDSPRSAPIAQADCPVTGKKLGSMGTPVRVEVGGRSVLLCCRGCERAIRESPDKYLARSPSLARPDKP